MSKTRVVHVNSPEFRDNPEAVYIGRKARRASDLRCRKDSPWANPYNVAEFGRTSAIAMYEALIRAMLHSDATRYDLLLLDGAVLGCWCHPKACHGDVLVKLIEELKKGPP